MAASVATETLGQCPVCGGEIEETERAWGCSNWRTRDGGCKWRIWREVAGVQLSRDVLKELLAQGETAQRIMGFRSRKGTMFSARLVLDRATGHVEFSFTPYGGVSGERSGGDE